MDKGEPPSPRNSGTPLFLIGRNSHGHWVVQDQRGLRGGLFVDRAEALKYAMFENGNSPQAVIMVPGVFELDMGSGNTNGGSMSPQRSPARAVNANTIAQDEVSLVA